jgi:hypothetical protein
LEIISLKLAAAEADRYAVLRAFMPLLNHFLSSM